MNWLVQSNCRFSVILFHISWLLSSLVGCGCDFLTVHHVSQASFWSPICHAVRYHVFIAVISGGFALAIVNEFEYDATVLHLQHKHIGHGMMS